MLLFQVYAPIIIMAKKLFMIFLTDWTRFCFWRTKQLITSSETILYFVLLSEICKKHSYQLKTVGGKDLFRVFYRKFENM